MEIIFKKVIFKNLLSYGDEEQVFVFKNGLDLVTAGNGKGKSAIIESIFYGLFGVPYRKIKNGSLINDINNKKLLIKIYFNIEDNEYEIHRGQKPNIFIIYKNGIEIPQMASVKEYQEFLKVDILKLNETVFRQLISVSANMTSSKPFMDLTQKEKESIFQVITDTSIFSQMDKKIKEKQSELKDVIKNYEYKIDILQKSINSQKIMIEEAKKQNEDFEKHHKNNIIQTEKSINDAENNVKKYEKGIKKLKELKVLYDEEIKNLEYKENILQDLNDKAKKVVEENLLKAQNDFNIFIDKNQSDFYNFVYKEEEELKENRERINIIKENLLNINYKLDNIISAKKSSIKCTKCNTTNYISSIDPSELEKEEIYKKEIELLEQDMDNLILLNDNLQKEIPIIKAKKKSEFEKLIEEKKKEYRDVQSRLKSEEDNYKKEERIKLQEEINNIKAIIEKYKEKLLKSKHIKDTLDENKSLVSFYKDKLNELNNIKLIKIDDSSLSQKEEELTNLKEEYVLSKKTYQDYTHLNSIIMGKGENNLKSQVILKTIPFLNKGINYFLEHFSLSDYNFILNEHFKETIISRDKGSEFNALSNGQKMRISFSILFSFLKLIEKKGGISTNILFLDESLDSSLDDIGRDEMLSLLNNEFNNKDVIIISHNEAVKNKIEVFNRFIEIKKDKFSKLSIS